MGRLFAASIFAGLRTLAAATAGRTCQIAICALALSALLPVGRAAAQAGVQADKAALVRLVEAGERENGFCAKTSFPRRTEIADFFKYLDDSTDGAEFLARSHYGDTGGCSYYKVVSVVQKAPQKCLIARSWACFDLGDDSGSCYKTDRKWCRTNGNWKRAE